MRSEVPAAARRRPAASLLKVRPFPGETTLSFTERLASTVQLTARELLRLLPQDGPKPLFQQFQADSEVFLGAETRTLLAAFCAVPEEHLRRALPAWDQLPPGEAAAGGHAGVRFRGVPLIADTCTACRMCTAQRTGQAVFARLYRPSHARICARHQTWLIGPHPAHHDGDDGDDGVQISLRKAPEVAAAQRRHLWLVRRRPHVAEAFAFAHAVVAGWWAQQWDEDGAWQRRFEFLVGGSRLPEDPWQQRVLTRDTVIYPEAVDVAMLLTDPQWQRGVAADTQGHLPHALADVPALLDELARRLERPRLAGLLAPSVNGPLIAWVRACARQGASTKPAQLWRVACAHRPAPLDKLLRAHRKDATTTPPVLPSTAQQGFEQGFGRARAHAAEHGHLCVTAKRSKNGFDLGQWLAR
ncbi:helicase associated domain-containing protein [Kitasatospora aureofaciens]|uniref:helicase associated domain-containing protein n=1 Tax=Kitasatospora aureofaciens TaxID=1894 RepID=UPI0037C86B3F